MKPYKDPKFSSVGTGQRPEWARASKKRKERRGGEKLPLHLEIIDRLKLVWARLHMKENKRIMLMIAGFFLFAGLARGSETIVLVVAGLVLLVIKSGGVSNRRIDQDEWDFPQQLSKDNSDFYTIYDPDRWWESDRS